MRCGCHECGAYMAQSEGLELGCVCPVCGYRCKACLGTNSVVSRDALRSFARDPAFLKEIFEEPDGFKGNSGAPEPFDAWAFPGEPEAPRESPGSERDEYAD